MPTYDYECEGCLHQLTDVKQSFNDEPLSFCPECKEPKLYRIVTRGIHVSVKGTNTIGQIADKNAKVNKNEIQEASHKKQGDTGSSPKPWYHKNATASSKEINSMTNKKKAKYIMEGKK